MLRQKRSCFGFTILELLVVTSIMGVFFSFILTSINDTRARARDARRIQDLNIMRTAMVLFYSKYNKNPMHYSTWSGVAGDPGVFVPSGTFPNNGACDAMVPGALGADPSIGGYINNIVPEAYNASMQELVDAGILGKIINSQGGPGYCYSDFGKNNSKGVVLMTALETGEATITGLPGTCRFSDGGSWCNRVAPASRVYCLCSPY